MNRCYLCGEIITELNNSVEHILPNSIGGKLKSTQVICRDCNGICGEQLDAALSQVGNIFASRMNIKRDRGLVPNLTAVIEGTDEKVIVEPGWKTRRVNPIIEKEKDKISISVGTRKRLLQEMQRIEKEFLKDGKNFITTEPVRIVDKNSNQNITFNVSVNKDRFLRSIAKIIASFYVFKTKGSSNVRDIGNFIKEGGDNIYVWFLNLFLNDKFFKEEKNHIISITGNAEEKILYGYFELFGLFGVICILNYNYQGKDIRLSYVFDPVKSKKNDLNVEFQVPMEQLVNFLTVKPNPKMEETT